MRPHSRSLRLTRRRPPPAAFAQKEICSFDWYDPNRRFLRAAFIEMVMSDNLNLEALESTNAFAETFDVPQIDALVNGPVFDLVQAKVDATNPKWLSPEDKFWHACANLSQQRGNKLAMWQYTKSTETFSVVDWVLVEIGVLKSGFFQRCQGYRTWSRWDKLLFAAGVPKTGQCSTFSGLGSVRCDLGTAARSHEDAEILNYHPSMSWSRQARFLSELLAILQFKTFAVNIAAAWRRGKYHCVAFRVVDGVFEWSSIVLLFLFPLLVTADLALLVSCQQVKSVNLF